MKKNLKLILGLFLPIVFFIGWISVLQYTINHAEEVVIRAHGYDPRNLISGHYMRLKLDWQETDCSQFDDNLCHPNRFDTIYKYYIPEKYGEILDDLISAKYVRVELIFAYPENKVPYLKRMNLNGQYWLDWIKSQKQ